MTIKGKEIYHKTMKKQKADAERESLAKELRLLIPKIDSEGLAFLVKQARVHLYNMHVEELNKAAKAVTAASAKSAKIAQSAGAKRGQGAAKTGAEKLRIEGTESGSSFYLCYRNGNVMFSRGEISHLVKIVNAPGTDIEIRERLYNWFDRERKDIFALLPIKDKADAHLKALAALLKKSFKFRG